MLRSRAYADKCTWIQVQRNCPVTCNAPCNRIRNPFRNNRPNWNPAVRGGRIQTVPTNTLTGQENSRYRHHPNGQIGITDQDKDEKSPNHDDDFFDHGTQSETSCRDSNISFQFHSNGRRIMCSDLVRNEYALGCTWERIQKYW
jgi:hypothetical protein